MKAFRDFDDYQPLAWIRGFPVYATTLLVGLHVSALLGTALVSALGGAGFLQEQFVFSSSAVLYRGAVWQWLTYAWVHWLANSALGPIFFIIEMALLYSFGREVEKYVGWRKYLWLYVLLLVASPAALTLLGLVTRTEIVLSGSGNLNFAVFIAFAALYPSAEIFFRIQARIVAWALVGFFSVMYLGARDWAQLCTLWANAGLAWFFINWVRDTLPDFQLFRRPPPRDPPVRVRPAPRSRPAPPREDPMAEIDPLLDKIARQGMNSLTAQEREMLERVREKLLKQPKA